MSKTETLEVFNYNDFFDDGPVSYVVEFSPDTLAMAQRLRAALPAEAFNIRAFYYGGVWLDKDGSESRMDFCMMIVSEHFIRFEGVPKHMGDDCTCYTDEIYFRELEQEVAA